VREVEQRDRFLVDEMLRHLEVVALEVRGGRDRLGTSTEARYALEHATEMLAEAAEKASRPFKTANSEIPWKGLRKLRHDVAHPYDTGAAPISLEQLWRFARNDAPRLARRLRTAEFSSGPERRARGE
jgi:uncharacterized protein with HEPN domain